MSISKAFHDVDQEAMYRAGYARGATAAISALAQRLSPDEQKRLEAWISTTLRPWARTGMATKTPPPDFPPIGVGG